MMMMMFILMSGTIALALGLSRDKIWQEKLFLGLVQIESKVHRLISICTNKPRICFLLKRIKN